MKKITNINIEEIKEEKDYISLEEATKYCDYHQDYLSLRARQKKLKAVKFGRNWVTTKEWLEEYLSKVEDYKNGNGKIETISEESLSVEKDLKIEKEESLSEEKIILYPIAKKEKDFSSSSKIFSLKLFFALTSVIIIVSGIFNFNILEKTANEILNNTGIHLSTKVTNNEIYLTTVGYTTKAIKGYQQWITEKIFNFGREVKSYVRNLFDRTKSFFASKEKTEEKIVIDKPEKEKEGLVVWPSGDDDEEMKKKIIENFSDEVLIETKDSLTGVIIPVFREREDDKYMYMLVPIEEEK